MGNRVETDLIVVHCSANPAGRDVTTEDIRKWHIAKGWSDIGYHYVIRLNGDVEAGRPLEQVGAHVYGYNQNSVGICLIGGVDADNINKAEDTFTAAQKESLRGLILSLRKTYPDAKVCGHRDLDNKKACPSFDVTSWLKLVGLADAARIDPKGA